MKDSPSKPDDVNHPRKNSSNHGKDPNSRSYLRGIQHHSPGKLRTAAIFATALTIHIPVTALSILGIFFSTEFIELDENLKLVLMIIILSLPLTCIFYLFFSLGSRCQVCSQKHFFISRARKHRNAHHFLNKYYILPLSLHLLIFNWFRCFSCGSSIRLKK